MRIWIYVIPLIGLAAIFGGLSLLMIESESGGGGRGGGSAAPDSVLLLCDAWVHPPVAGVELEHGGGVIELFLRRSGVRVDAEYAPSEELLELIRNERAADLFVPGDEVYLEAARAEGLVEEVFEVAALAPVILVRRGNPDGIEELADLGSGELRIALVDADASAIGRVTHELFEQHGVALPQGANRIAPPGPGAVDHARSVQAGEADAAIVWKPVATQFPRNTEYIEIPPEQNITAPLHLALLTTSHHPEEARQFAAFMAGSVGREVFERYQYHVEWDDDF